MRMDIICKRYMLTLLTLISFRLTIYYMTSNERNLTFIFE